MDLIIVLEEAVAVQALLEIQLQDKELQAQGGQVCLLEIKDLVLPLIFQMDISQEAGGDLVIQTQELVVLVAVGQGVFLIIIWYLAQQLPIQEAVAAAGMVLDLLRLITEFQGDQVWCSYAIPIHQHCVPHAHQAPSALIQAHSSLAQPAPSAPLAQYLLRNALPTPFHWPARLLVQYAPPPPYQRLDPPNTQPAVAPPGPWATSRLRPPRAALAALLARFAVVQRARAELFVLVIIWRTLTTATMHVQSCCESYTCI